MLPVTNTTVRVSNVSKGLVTSEKRNLRETIIMGIQGLTLKVSLDVVSDNSDLVPASPESLGGR